MNSSLRSLTLGIVSLGGVLTLAALTRFTSACVSSGGGGAVDTPCESMNDCTTPYQCLPVTTDYTCSPDAGDKTIYTCQLACSSPANCGQLSGSYTCSMALSKCIAPNAEICMPEPDGGS
jgi:hypothetical protein